MIKRIAAYWKSIKAAGQLSSRHPVGVLLEALFLRARSRGALGLTEYLDLCLYRNDWYQKSEKKHFAGLRLVHDIDVSSEINTTRWEIFGIDKLAFYLICRGADISIPETLACYSESHRASGPIKQLYNEASLSTFLLAHAQTPLFVKPVAGSYGAAAHTLIIDPAAANPVLIETARDSQSLSLVEYENYLTSLRPRHRSMMFQLRLDPHEKLRELAGPYISGIRIGIVKRENTATIYAAVLKINAGENITDNFEHGGSGNLLANVDLDYGTVSRVICGAGINAHEITHHPKTGVQITGFRVPDWEEAAALSRRVIETLPGIRLAGVDIAITNRGPVVLEINIPGDFDLLQIASRKGVMSNPEFRALVAELR